MSYLRHFVASFIAFFISTESRTFGVETRMGVFGWFGFVPQKTFGRW
jgi:hypothetical protein